MQLRKDTEEQNIDTVESISPQTDQDYNNLMEQLQTVHDLLTSTNPQEAPTVAQLEIWRSTHGSIYFSKIIGDSNYYVWRTLKRGEFKVLKDRNPNLVDQEAWNELIVEKCTLYPKVDVAFRFNSDAGIITTLSNQIQYHSGFISEAEALSLVRVI